MAFLSGGEFDWLRSRVQSVLWTAPPPAPPPTFQTIYDKITSAIVFRNRDIPTAAAVVDSYRKFKTDVLDQPEIPPGYVYQEYPRMLYGRGETIIVKNRNQHLGALKAGYKETP